GETRRRPRLGRAARSIESAERGTIPDDRKQGAAQAVAARLDDGKGDRRCQRGVDRIAASLQHGDARLRRQWLRGGDDVARANRLTARWVRQAPVEAIVSANIAHYRDRQYRIG